MAFLDNSGDIILDAVLTDTGRFRLAKGDGSFKIVKYAYADDEIDYSKYNKNHASGSAYYDLDVLKTPVLEAFTNNASSMKHRLMSLPKTNLLYLPVVLLNESSGKEGGYSRNQTVAQARDMYVVMVDETTEDKITGLDPNTAGVIKGFSNNGGQNVVVDQGLNTTSISFKFALDPDLTETRYIVNVDNRLGSITDNNGNVQTPNFIDDDNIASYSFTFGTNANVTNIGTAENDSVVSGPRGTRFTFSIVSSIELNSSTYLFTKLGSSSKTFTVGGTTLGTGGSGTLYTIDSLIKITGATTGRSLDVPVRFLKWKS